MYLEFEDFDIKIEKKSGELSILLIEITTDFGSEKVCDIEVYEKYYFPTFYNLQCYHDSDDLTEIQEAINYAIDTSFKYYNMDKL